MLFQVTNFGNFIHHQTGSLIVQKVVFSGLIIGLFLSIIACNLLIVDEEASDYPTVYHRISLSDLQQMNAEYKANNNGHICSTLNQYGFTGFSEILFEDGENPCERTNRDVVRIEMDNTDTLLTAAKKALLKNSTYTGVEDTSALVLKELLSLPGCINCGRPGEYSANIEWKLTFEEQKIDTTVVRGTEITVVIDAKGVNRIWGHWYPDFNIPDFMNYGYLEVQRGVIGWEIDLRNYTGEELIYTVREEDVREKPEKIYLPVENEDESELAVRTCWAVPILYSGESFKGWIAFIDIEEGLLIELAAK